MRKDACGASAPCTATAAATAVGLHQLDAGSTPTTMDRSAFPRRHLMEPPLLQLHDAARKGDEQQLAAALAAGAPVDGMLHGRTALHWACWSGQSRCAELLVEAGANQAAVAPLSGTTPLHLAAMGHTTGHTECVAALLAAAAASAAQPYAMHADAFGRTPLHWAVLYGALDSARLLAAAGPEAAVLADHYSETPITLAGSSEQHSVWILALPPATLVASLPQLQGAWPRLGAALPEALQRSEVEAALLVRHMTTEDRRQLRTLALCLGLAHRRGSLPWVPGSIMQRLLAEGAAQHAQRPLPPRARSPWQRLPYQRMREERGGTQQAQLTRRPDGFIATVLVSATLFVFVHVGIPCLRRRHRWRCHSHECDIIHMHTTTTLARQSRPHCPLNVRPLSSVLRCYTRQTQPQLSFSLRCRSRCPAAPDPRFAQGCVYRL